MSWTKPTKIRRLSVLLAGVLATAVVALPASAARLEQPTPGTYILKDGTTLSVAKNGWMRMYTAEGQRLNMKDGVVMETKDGDSHRDEGRRQLEATAAKRNAAAFALIARDPIGAGATSAPILPWMRLCLHI